MSITEHINKIKNNINLTHWKFWSLLLNDWVVSDDSAGNNYKQKIDTNCCQLKDLLPKDFCNFIPSKKQILLHYGNDNTNNSNKIFNLIANILNEEINILRRKDIELSNYFNYLTPRIDFEKDKVSLKLKNDFVKMLKKNDYFPYSSSINSLRFWSQQGKDYGGVFPFINHQILPEPEIFKNHLGEPSKLTTDESRIVSEALGYISYIQFLKSSKFKFTEFICEELLPTCNKPNLIILTRTANNNNIEINCSKSDDLNLNVLSFSLPSISDSINLTNYNNNLENLIEINDGIIELNTERIKSCWSESEKDIQNFSNKNLSIIKKLNCNLCNCEKLVENNLELQNQLKVVSAIPKWKYIYFISASELLGKKYKGFGVWFLFSREPLSPFWYNSLCKLFNIYISKLGIEDWAAAGTKHAINSAVAAIMARNMSHNIGSHVLYYLSSQDDFYSYLQSRMDYIATITSSVPSWVTPFDFFSVLFEPFILGTKKEAKKSRQDQVKLINNIAKSEGLEAKDISFLIKYNNCSYEYNYSNNKSYYDVPQSSPPKTMIDVYHGFIGAQAFYAILENFIRNSAKHNREFIKNQKEKNKNNFKVIIEIELDNYNENFYKISLSNNLGNFDNENYKKLSELLYTPLIDINNANQLEPTAWGIKEMRLSAMWLRGFPSIKLPTCAEEELKPPLLTIKEPNSSKNIKYEFYLPKPREVLLVTDKDCINANNQMGFYTIKFEDFCKIAKEKSSDITHKFIVLDNDIKNSDWKNWVKENATKLQYRVLNESSASLNFNDPQSIIFHVYEQWLCKLWKVDKFCELPKIFFNKNFGNNTKKIWKIFDPINNEMKEINENNEEEMKIIEDFKNNMIIFDHDDRGNPKDCIYWEPYSTGSGTCGDKIGQLFSSDRTDDGTKRRYIYELYETALTKVIIADERIWSDRNKLLTVATKNYQAYKIFEKMGIILIDIIKKNGEIYVKKMDNNEEREIKFDEFLQNLEKVSFFLIHKGIINDVIDANKFYNNTKNMIIAKIPYLVVHTGRGTKDIPHDVKVLEVANLANELIIQPDKHFLVNILMNLKRGE